MESNMVKCPDCGHEFSAPPEKLKCKRCKHEWWPRTPELPEICPNCKSPYWNKPRQRKSNRGGN